MIVVSKYILPLSCQDLSLKIAICLKLDGSISRNCMKILCLDVQCVCFLVDNNNSTLVEQEWAKQKQKIKRKTFQFWNVQH
jgi:hypothetical protein